MVREHEDQLSESEPARKEYIGHITTPIEKDQEQILTILEQHHVMLIDASHNHDNWWTLYLPQGTTKILKDSEDSNSPCTVQLPDGYCFEYVPPIFSKFGKVYQRFPKIALPEEPQGT